jgi:hypothetical protein
MIMNLNSNRFDRKKINNFIVSQWNNYNENLMMDSARIESSRQPEQFYIITTCTDGPIVLHESDFVRKERHYRKGHNHNKCE